MTTDEAIRRLKEARGTIQPFRYINEAIDYAIKALEQEPCEDCISRAEAMAEMQMNANRYSLAKEFGGMGQIEWSDYLIPIEDTLNILRDLPNVQPKAEQEPCEDCISRQALIERINNAEENFKSDNMESIASDDGDPFVDGVLSGVFNIREMVIQAPPVTPQPKRAATAKIREVYHDNEHRSPEFNAGLSCALSILEGVGV